MPSICQEKQVNNTALKPIEWRIKSEQTTNIENVYK